MSAESTIKRSISALEQRRSARWARAFMPAALFSVCDNGAWYIETLRAGNGRTGSGTSPPAARGLSESGPTGVKEQKYGKKRAFQRTCG